jgi:hypothetical protein
MLYVPPAAATTKSPVLFALHGHGGTTQFVASCQTKAEARDPYWRRVGRTGLVRLAGAYDERYPKA